MVIGTALSMYILSFTLLQYLWRWWLRQFIIYQMPLNAPFGQGNVAWPFSRVHWFQFNNKEKGDGSRRSRM